MTLYKSNDEIKKCGFDVLKALQLTGYHGVTARGYRSNLGVFGKQLILQD